MVSKSKPKSDLPLVPEAILRKRHREEDRARLEAAAPDKKTKELRTVSQAGKKKKAIYVKKPETIIARARSRRNNEVRFQRVLKKGMQKRSSNRKETGVREIVDGETTVEQSFQSNSVGAPMVFVVRIRDNVGISPSVKSVLRKFRLHQQHEGVFLPYDEAHRKLLHLVEPFVIYGPPSKGVVQDLIVRRGFGKNAEGKRIPLSDNLVIEQALGEEANIICVEDLVHEICNVGEGFNQARGFLWPFQLADDKTEFERRTLKQKDGMNYGDRGQAIDEYIQQIL